MFSRSFFLKSPLFLLLGLGSSSVMAQTIGSVVDNVSGGGLNSGTFASFLALFSGVCYLLALKFGIKTVSQLKAHADNPHQNKLMTAFVSMIISSFLISMPSTLQMLQDTFGLNGNAGFLAGLSAGTPSGGSGTPDLSTMFISLAASIPALMKFVSLGSICAGAFLILRAFLLLPQLEQGRVEMGKIIWMLIAGVGLWSILPLISASFSTLGAPSDAQSVLTAKYSQSQGSGFDAAIASVLLFVQFIGLIAFIRGAMRLKMVGENKDGSMSSALIHLLGGSAAMNISWTIGILANTISAHSAICGLSAVLCS